MVEKLPKAEFDYIYSKVPRLTVEILIEEDQGILLTKRTIPPREGYWYLPGKTLLMGLSLEEGAKWVAKDELGVEIEVGKLVEVLDWLNTGDADGQVVALVYEAKISKGQTVKLNNEASEYGFFKIPPPQTPKTYLDHFFKKYLKET